MGDYILLVYIGLIAIAVIMNVNIRREGWWKK